MREQAKPHTLPSRLIERSQLPGIPLLAATGMVCVQVVAQPLRPPEAIPRCGCARARGHDARDDRASRNAARRDKAGVPRLVLANGPHIRCVLRWLHLRFTDH